MAPAPMLLAFLVVTGALASGCLTAMDESQPPGVAILVAWQPDAWHYVLAFPPGTESVPTGLVLRVTEIQTGHSEDVPADALVPLGNASFEARPAMRVEAGRDYLVETLLHSKASARREIAAAGHGSPLVESPEEETVYDLVLRVEEPGDEPTLMEMAGESRWSTTEDGRTRHVMRANGMSSSEDEIGVRTRMTLETRTVEIDGETTEGFSRGEGTWEIDERGTQGEGTASMRQEFEGREDKPDAEGLFHLAERTSLYTLMEGEVRSGGDPRALRMEIVGHEWSRVDSGALLWRAANQTVTYTIDGDSHEETTTKDEAVRPGEEDPFILDVFDWRKGVQPHPIVPGDAFETHSWLGARIRYHVEVLEPAPTPGGEAARVLLLRGVAEAEDGHGSETWRILADGGQRVVSSEVAYVLGAQTARMEMSLRQAP